MESISRRKTYWNLMPLLLTFMVIGLLFYKSFELDIISFKKESSLIYNLFLVAIFCLPLFLLPFFAHWKNQLFHKKLLLVGLSVFLIAMNFRIQQAFQISIFFSATVIFYFIFEKKIYRPNLFYVLLFLYFGLNAVSLLWTSNLSLGITHLLKLSPLAFIPLLFCFFRLSKQDFNMIALFLFRFSMIFAFISVCSWIIESRFLNFPIEMSLTAKKYVIDSHPPYDVVYAWSNKVHPTYNAILLLFSLSIGWYYIFKKDVEDNIGYLEFAFIFFVTFLLSIITASRFMFALWVIINIVGVLLSLRKNKKVFLVVSSIFIVSVISVIGSFSEKISSFVDDPVRSCHYAAAFESIEQNTWFGTGLGGMTKYINRNNPVYAPLNIGSGDRFSHIHPHNQFVGDMMQTGVLGLIFILFIMGSLFYSSIKYRNWLLLMTSLMFLLLMNVEMPLMFISGIFTFSLISSFIVQVNIESKVLYDFNKKK